MLLKRGDFKRNYLFCNKCIDWAKTEVLRLRERVPQNPQYSPISQSSEAGASRSTPDPFSEAMNDPMNDPMMEAHNNYSIVGQRLANPTDSPLHLGKFKSSADARQTLITHDISIAFSQQCHL